MPPYLDLSGIKTFQSKILQAFTRFQATFHFLNKNFIMVFPKRYICCANYYWEVSVLDKARF